MGREQVRGVLPQTPGGNALRAVDTERVQELLDQTQAAAGDAVRALAMALDDALAPALGRMCDLQRAYTQTFPVLPDEVEFWEKLWRCTDLLRDQWLRVERAARRAGTLPRVLPALDEQRTCLYQWTRAFICQHAQRPPSEAHFELGIATRRADCRGLHERIEGLYESIKRVGRLPDVRLGLEMPEGNVNFGIIYGGGWNVSSYSVLREAARIGDMSAFVAFDHPGEDLYGAVCGRTVRLATAGLVQVGGEDGYALATFARPVPLHFICPHQWTGPPAHELGAPLLRSELTLEIVNNKLRTSEALRWHAERTGADLPLIPEAGVEQASVPADFDVQLARAEAALATLERRGVREVVVKPSFGEQARGLGMFTLPAGRARAVEHAAALSLESSAVIQERIRPAGGLDCNFRVLVASSPTGGPTVVGRFARLGQGDDVEMVEEREMLRRAGVEGEEAERLLERLERVSLDAFRAVAQYAEAMHPHFPWRPLGGGSYAVPYFIGTDLIGESLVMEVNGDEVGGLWTDDRLHPDTRGRSSRMVLQAAREAAMSYRAALTRA